MDRKVKMLRMRARARLDSHERALACILSMLDPRNTAPVDQDRCRERSRPHNEHARPSDPVQNAGESVIYLKNHALARILSMLDRATLLRMRARTLFV